MTIKLEFNMADDFFGSILCTALAGGIDYWAETRRAKLCEDPVDGYISVEIRPDREEGSAFEDGDKRNDWQVIKHADIEQAIQKIVDDLTGARLNADDRLIGDHIALCIFAAVAQGDAGDIDADAADCIIQIACFGELVFG